MLLASKPWYTARWSLQKGIQNSLSNSTLYSSRKKLYYSVQKLYTINDEWQVIRIIIIRVE